MRKKYFLVLLVVFLGISVSACTRNASDPGSGTPSSNDQISAVLTQVASRTPLTTPFYTPSVTESGGGVDPDADNAYEQGTPLVTNTLGVITATPTKKATSIPTPNLVVPSTYSLEKGEFPYCIARRFDIDISALLSANNLSKDGLYKEGLTLTIPQNATSFKGSRSLREHPTTYTVLSGDTFYRIACKFGDIYPEEIAAANGMTLKDDLTVGSTIEIP
ncbi:MAG: LysM peptidoglycan-binding domain-containing protein [Anaerolineales bacterium]|jgi:LysM repeat protein